MSATSNQLYVPLLERSKITTGRENLDVDYLSDTNLSSLIKKAKTLSHDILMAQGQFQKVESAYYSFLRKDEESENSPQEQLKNVSSLTSKANRLKAREQMILRNFSQLEKSSESNEEVKEAGELVKAIQDQLKFQEKLPNLTALLQQLPDHNETKSKDPMKNLLNETQEFIRETQETVFTSKKCCVIA